MRPGATQPGMFFQAAADDHPATKLIGMAVYESPAKDAKKIGDMSDLMIGKDGQTDAVIIGVGGFLGLGKKDVAINYDQLHWAADPNGGPRLVAGPHARPAEAAPAFDYAVLESNQWRRRGQRRRHHEQQTAANSAKAGGRQHSGQHGCRHRTRARLRTA